MTTPTRILIVDDEQSFLRSTARLLADEGYVCHSTGSGVEAQAALAAGEYDLVLADIRMPGNLELEFFRTMRDKYPDLPLIVITGYPSLDTAIRCIRFRVWDYLVKPIDVDTLKERIERCLAETRERRS